MGMHRYGERRFTTRGAATALITAWLSFTSGWCVASPAAESAGVAEQGIETQAVDLMPGTMATGTTATFAAGRTPGVFGVSHSGAATYRIPLWTPPGVGEVGLDLALVYASRGGSGSAALAGRSRALAITRCNRTWAQDGARAASPTRSPIAICLDGQQLKLVSGTHGMAGAVYATEVETFSRIVANGRRQRPRLVHRDDQERPDLRVRRHRRFACLRRRDDHHSYLGAVACPRPGRRRHRQCITLTYFNEAQSGAYTNGTHPHRADCLPDHRNGRGAVLPRRLRLFGPSCERRAHGLPRRQPGARSEPARQHHDPGRRRDGRSRRTTLDTTPRPIRATATGQRAGVCRLDLPAAHDHHLPERRERLATRDRYRGGRRDQQPRAARTERRWRHRPALSRRCRQRQVELAHPARNPSGFAAPLDTGAGDERRTIIPGASSATVARNSWSCRTGTGTSPARTSGLRIRTPAWSPAENTAQRTSTATASPTSWRRAAGSRPPSMCVATSRPRDQRLRRAVRHDGELVWTIPSPRQATPWDNLRVADLNGDGRADIVALTFSTVREIRNSSPRRCCRTASATHSPSAPKSLSLQESMVTMADWNADGCSDILQVRSVFVSNCAGAFVGLATRATAATGDSLYTVMPADWNGDGRADLLYIDAATRQWFVVRSTGEGAARPSDGHPCAYLDRLVRLDADGDGLTDLGFATATTATGLRYRLHARRPSRPTWPPRSSTASACARAPRTSRSRAVTRASATPSFQRPISRARCTW